MDKIARAITRLFDKHRIVFRYDAKQELRQEYESLWLLGLDKIEAKEGVKANYVNALSPIKGFREFPKTG